MATWIGPADPGPSLGAREGAAGLVFVLVGMLELGMVGEMEKRAVPAEVAEGALVMQAYPRLLPRGNGWMIWPAARWWAGYSVQLVQLDPTAASGARRFLAR